MVVRPRTRFRVWYRVDAGPIDVEEVLIGRGAGVKIDLADKHVGFVVQQPREILGRAGASADTITEANETFQSTRTRAEVKAEAVQQARSHSIGDDGSQAFAQAKSSPVDVKVVRAEAVRVSKNTYGENAPN